MSEPMRVIPSAAEIISTCADELPVGVWVARAPGGEFVYANKCFAEIMGTGGLVDVAVGGYSEPYGIFTRDGVLYPENRLPFVRALEERQCFDFDNARDALTWLSTCADQGTPLPSLILLDLIMPGMNGWQFRDAQRKLPALASIPVAVVTADVKLPSQNLSCEMLSKLMTLEELKALLSRCG